MRYAYLLLLCTACSWLSGAEPVDNVRIEYDETYRTHFRGDRFEIVPVGGGECQVYDKGVQTSFAGGETTYSCKFAQYDEATGIAFNDVSSSVVVHLNGDDAYIERRMTEDIHSCSGKKSVYETLEKRYYIDGVMHEVKVTTKNGKSEETVTSRSVEAVSDRFFNPSTVLAKPAGSPVKTEGDSAYYAVDGKEYEWNVPGEHLSSISTGNDDRGFEKTYSDYAPSDLGVALPRTVKEVRSAGGGPTFMLSQDNIRYSATEPGKVAEAFNAEFGQGVAGVP